MKVFDLIYVIKGNRRTMSCGIINMDDLGASKLIGPFPAKEAAPLIVDALLAENMGFLSRKDAETAYMLEHMKNIVTGHNRSGQSYPFEI